MAKQIQCIGVLTSGGDAPGMNAAIRSVTRTALYNNIAVKGIYQGFCGLLEQNIRSLQLRSVSNVLGQGGTMLYTSRCPDFKKEYKVLQAAEICKQHGIDAVVVIGGDGSFRGAGALSHAGIPCIGVPATIDNDIASTDFTIGFDTAVHTVVENIDRLRDTTQAHERCSVVEVMGRNCGDIALHSAICSGAVSVLVPEVPCSLEQDIIEPMKRTLSTGKNHFIVIVAEGVAGKIFTDSELFHSARLAQYITEQTGIEARTTVIGYVQRGGSPTPRDRVLAAKLGSHAVRLLCNGISNSVVGEFCGSIVHYPLEEALKMKKTIDQDLIRIAKEISI